MTRDLQWRIIASRAGQYLYAAGIDETSKDANQFLAEKLEQFCADHLMLNRELWKINAGVREAPAARDTEGRAS